MSPRPTCIFSPAPPSSVLAVALTVLGGAAGPPCWAAAAAMTAVAQCRYLASAARHAVHTATIDQVGMTPLTGRPRRRGTAARDPIASKL